MPCKRKVHIGITMGDPAGAGPSLIIKSLPAIRRLGTVTVIGDSSVLGKLQGIQLIDLKNVDRLRYKPGVTGPHHGAASVEYIDKALELLRRRQIDCLVTNPVSKEAIAAAGVRFVGHTEYLAERVRCKKYAMMLLNNKLKTVLLTRHVALHEVSAHINKEKISVACNLAYNGLQSLFNLKRPRIVVCALNPHAADKGLFGTEEEEVIQPVVKRLRKRMPGLIGPIASDVALMKTLEGEFDCALTMYHDQSLIALKISGGLSGVNLTLGLPFIRTSPLHGTAFDIVQSGKRIDTGSFLEAVRLAASCACRN